VDCPRNLAHDPSKFEAGTLPGSGGESMKGLRVAMGFLLALATMAAAAAERDILDAALERSQGTTVNGQPVRFGNPELDSAEIRLRDYLPRPWTATRIHALYLAAYKRLGESETNDSLQDQFSEWRALVEALGTILAASREPRAALALGRALNDSRVMTCALHRSFLQYFGSDGSYQRPPAEESVPHAGNGCELWPENALKWWLLNERELERRAAASTSGSPPCANCEQEALATIDQLRSRLHDSAPTLHLTIEGGGAPRVVQVEYSIRPTSGQSGGSNGTMRSNPYNSPDIRLPIPVRLLGRSDMRLSGMVMSTGYKSVPIELDRINDARVVPVTLVPEGGN
jgi:hypothetical protein